MVFNADIGQLSSVCMLEDTVYTVARFPESDEDREAILIDGALYYFDIEYGELGEKVVIH